MKNSWQYKKVSEIADYSLGKMLNKAKNKGEMKPYLRNLNVRWFDFDLSDVLEMRFQPGEAARYTAVKGDVLICEGGYPGRAAIWARDEPIYFQKALHRVRFHEQERSKWFLYYLYAKDLDGTLKNHFNGAGIQHFTGEALAQFEVPVPPLPELRRVVDLLDEAFEAIGTAKGNAEKNVLNARAIFESYLQFVFSQRDGEWVETSLGEAYDVRDGTHDSPKYQATGYPLITSKNLKREGLSFDDVNLIGEQDYKKINNRSAVHKGDVLFAMIGTIGNPTLVTVEPKFAIKNVALFKVPAGQDGAFLRHYLNSDSVISKMTSEAKGTTQRFVGLGYLRAFQIKVPPLTKQLEVVRRLDELSGEARRLEGIYQQKVAALEALKKSLLHQAFTGCL